VTDFLKDPFTQRISLTLLAFAAFALAAFLPQVRAEFAAAGGTLFGWAQLKQPGSVSGESLAIAVKAATLPPPKMFPDDVPDVRTNLTPVEGRRP
jgi:hypothetical protein